VKFAVKEIRYKEEMEIDNNKNISSQETNGSGEEFEEYEEVESIML
jgi:hypothetical protein